MGCGYGRRGEDWVGECTESLGSESGDVGGDAEIIDQLAPVADDEEARVEPQVAVESSPEKRRGRLPPAMPRAAEAFMRAERRGGRLILTEERVEQRPRREVFLASRAGGRLRLRFAADDDDGASPDGEKETETGGGGVEKGAAGGVVVAVHSGCCNGAGEFCQVAAGAGRRRVEVGAVMGT
ncbi:protein SUGARY ENHANCER 1-like [Phragmites australis]|uniref:protein SUGARY ENHANCER 1-like n=1 Tax=Phragmites australis TaxID=29695 RepID=UPI002D76E336|nr:protein SUGARY ENHANCER 1-like [Phragmites australis]